MGLTRITSDGITDATIATADLADQSVTLAKLPHGTSSNDGKFLRANNGADPTFETVNTDLSADSSPQLGGDLDVNDFNIKNGTAILDITTNQRFEFGVAGTTVVDINGNGVDFKAGNNTHADNVESRFGTGNDLKIYHNGTHSFIQDSGTGNLMLATSAFQVTNAAVSETMIYALPDGAVNLYYDNSKKFETTSTGVSIDGNITAGDNNHLFLGDSQDINIYHDGSDSYFYSGASTLFFRNASNEKFASFISNGAVELYHDNSKKFETHSGGVNVTGSVNPTGNVALVDNSKVKLGTGDDLQIYHNGSGSFIDAYTSHLQIRNENSEIMAAFNRNGTVDIYHDGGKKFASHSNGLSIKNEAGGSSTSLFLFGSEGESAEIQMNADDGDDNADYFRLIHMASDNTWRLQNYAGGGWENNIKANGNGAVELYNDNALKLQTTSNGVIIDNTCRIENINNKVSSMVNAKQNIEFKVHQTNGQSALQAAVKSNGVSGWGGQLEFYTKNADGNPSGSLIGYLTLNVNGHLLPTFNGTQDLGGTSQRWRNIYTNDLNLSNEGGANDVDGTWGSYTIQEGEESLFLINKRNGKKYKFNLTEVS